MPWALNELMRRSRNGTNTDLLRGLIRVLVDHPDGFVGEVVVGENTQFANPEGFDRALNNAGSTSTGR